MASKQSHILTADSIMEWSVPWISQQCCPRQRTLAIGTSIQFASVSEVHMAAANGSYKLVCSCSSAQTQNENANVTLFALFSLH